MRHRPLAIACRSVVVVWGMVILGTTAHPDRPEVTAPAPDADPPPPDDAPDADPDAPTNGGEAATDADPAPGHGRRASRRLARRLDDGHRRRRLGLVRTIL